MDVGKILAKPHKILCVHHLLLPFLLLQTCNIFLLCFNLKIAIEDQREKRERVRAKRETEKRKRRKFKIFFQSFQIGRRKQYTWGSFITQTWFILHLSFYLTQSPFSFLRALLILGLNSSI